MVSDSLPPRLLDPATRARIAGIAESYERLAGRALVPVAGDVIEALWSAPAAIVAHGTEADPVFFFGNRAALARFALGFDAFTTLPSRLSAESMLRAERQALLDRVARDGLIDDYSGIRIAATGARFRIERASVWNLVDAEGAIHGQAAAFDRWTDLEG